MSGRVDYVKVRLGGTQSEKMDQLANYQLIASQVCELHQIAGKPYDDRMVFDQVTRTWSTYFNIWGPAAEPFYQHLEVADFKRVTRLDYRVECTNPQLDLELVGLTALKNAKKKNLSRAFYDGPIRVKRDGRDIGGPSVAIGGKGSPRRIAIYSRGHETPAVEGQFAQKRLADVIKNTYTAMVISPGRFQDMLKTLLEIELDQLCRDRLLHPLSTFTQDMPMIGQNNIAEAHERVTEQINLLWELLDTEQRTTLGTILMSRLKPDDEPSLDSDSDEPEIVSSDYYDGDSGETETTEEFYRWESSQG